jgi:glutamate decarboxylase
VHSALKISGKDVAQISQDGRPNVVSTQSPQELQKILADVLQLPDQGTGKEGVVGMVEKVLEWSVNTWDQGFMDKLYASTNAVSRLDQCEGLVLIV